MNKQLRFLSALAVIATLIAFSSVGGAGAAGHGNGPHIHPEDPAIVSEAVSKTRGLPVEPYGVGVTPAVYLVNFLLLYIANPNEAANMPAYRTPIPLALSACLEKNPEGCRYSAFAQFFDGNANGNKSCSLPPDCQEDPQWARLAPGIASNSSQINEPLGMDRAKRLARLLGIDNSMILTDWEYQCTIGTPADRSYDQKTIVACINNLTNSNGNTNIPLSSYGLAITDDDKGDVQSLCAPEAPCLVFNDLFAGPLEKIAIKCGWEMKLDRMVHETPFVQLIADGHKCQQFGGAGSGACIVEPVCPRLEK
ncbi:MAG: hypothetical protein ACXWT4_11130 [Methylobacter sp.]